MSDIFDNLGGKFQEISIKISKEGKRYLQSAVSKGEELSQKGKIQIEIEKFYNGKIRVIDSTHIVAKSVSNELRSRKLLNISADPKYYFYVSR